MTIANPELTLFTLDKNKTLDGQIQPMAWNQYGF